MRFSVFLLALSASVMFGCTASESTRDVSRFQLERDEIQKSSAATVSDLIRQQRPGWLLESRRDHSAYASGTRVEGFVVYLDGQKYGRGSSALANLTTSRIQTIDYLDANEALSRFGRGHEEGALRIVTRRKAAATKDDEN